MKLFKKIAFKCPLLLILFYFLLRIRRGFSVYRMLCKEYGIEREWYSPFSVSSGDAYYAACAYNSLVRRHGTRAKACFLVTGVGQKRLADWLQIVPTISISDQETHNLSRLQRFLLPTVELPIHILHCQPAQMYLQLNEYLLSFRSFDFLSMSLTAYGNMDRSELVGPDVSEGKQASVELLHSYGLSEGRTVLLSPYAYCIDQLPMSFWAELAKQLHQIGYYVCTNCAGKREKPIPGTVGVFIPYTLVIPFLEQAGYLIALRSGFVDITGQAICKKVILYPRCNQNMWGVGSPKDCFSLSNMGIQNNCLELEYDSRDNLEDLAVNCVRGLSGK